MTILRVIVLLSVGGVASVSMFGCNRRIADGGSRLFRDGVESKPHEVAKPVIPRADDDLGANTIKWPVFREMTAQDLAVDALARIGPEAIPALTQALRHANPRTRQAAAKSLARMGPAAKAAIDDLIAALDDEDEDVRKQAIRTLGQIGPDAAAAIPALVNELK